MIKPINECKTVAELLADPKRWTQHRYAKNQFRNPVLYDDPSAICWCLLGAINKIYSNISQVFDAEKKIHRVIKWAPMTEFNDNNDYQTVYAKVLEAGI